MKYLIGLDIGTSSVKGVLMNEVGEIKRTAHGVFKYTKTKNNGIEIEADDFVAVCFTAIRELASAADAPITAICASSASGNLLILDKKNTPITPIFNWQDERTTTEGKDVLGNLDADDFYFRIGWPFDFKTFPLGLACYLKKNSPEKIEDCGIMCMSTEYLYYRLTGKWGISTSAGTPFYLIDQQSGRYIPEVLNSLGITEEQLPPIMPCGTLLGGITDRASKECGLKTGTNVVIGSFDHPSAARGVGVFEEGDLLLSCGTSWVGFAPVKDRNKATNAKLLIDPFLSDKNGCWGTMVSVASISERIKLYVERYIDNTPDCYKIMSKLAAKSTTGAGGLTLDLRDYPDDDMIKKFPGEDIARAIMEGTVNLLRNQLERIKKMGIDPKSAVMVGGPSADPMWSELIEEICGIHVRVQHGVSAGAVGAAVMAGIGAGLYADEKDALRNFDKE